ncbi:MAG: hypothetical protein KGN16_10335 [Burkholderiales bacterium]|nr:hypothetical protein [Burkholderiales bacterium]
MKASTRRLLQRLQLKRERTAARAAREPERIRAAWLAHWRHERRRLRLGNRFMVGPVFPELRPPPAHLAGACCCASTRSGPCQRQDLNPRNGRCPAHGGRSTGPRTAAGLAAAAANLANHPMRSRVVDPLQGDQAP